MEPRYNKPVCNEVLGITNDFLYPSNSKVYGKEPPNVDITKLRYSEQIRHIEVPLYNKTLWLQTNFVSPLALWYIEAPLYNKASLYSEQILSVLWPFVISRFHCMPKPLYREQIFSWSVLWPFVICPCCQLLHVSCVPVSNILYSFDKLLDTTFIV